jgi:Concanavalin A-like lectin/glucanases superfamily
MSTVGGGVNIVTNGLVLYLDASNTKSYVSGSTTWNDVSRSENNGTLTNGPTFNSGNGGSIVFDGSNQYVSIGVNSITGSSAFTLCGWLNVKTHSNYGIALFMGTASTSQSAFIGYVRTAQVGTTNSIGGGLFGVNYGSGILQNTGFHYVCLTYNGGAGGIMVVYVDGINRVSGTTTANIGTTSLRMGSSNTGTFIYNGNIAQSSIYNRALSASEVLQNYNATKSRFGL